MPKWPKFPPPFPSHQRPACRLAGEREVKKGSKISIIDILVII